MKDWTAKGNRANSSVVFNEIVDDVARVLGHHMLCYSVEDTARLIVARLARTWKLAPVAEADIPNEDRR